MATYETALLLTAGIVSGICPFVLSAYRGGSRTIILPVIAGPLAALGCRWLASEALALCLCAGLVLLTAALFNIRRGERPVA